MKNLRTNFLKLARQAEKALKQAEQTDNPEDWDAWKEAEGVSAGYRMALDDFENLLK